MNEVDLINVDENYTHEEIIDYINLLNDYNVKMIIKNLTEEFKSSVDDKRKTGAILTQRIAAGLRQVSHQFLVERGAAFGQRLVVPGGRLEQIGGFPAVATPVRPEVLSHILNRI